MELTVKTPFFKLTKEASETGWRGLLQINNGELMDAEEWNGNQLMNSNNQREMTAVLMSLRAFSPILQQMNVDCLPLQTDSTKTVFCQRNWRSAKALIHIARIIFQLLENLIVSLLTWYIKGIHNNKTDMLSRMAHHRNYSISIPALNQAITFLQLVPTIDIFASRTMKRCEWYYSPQQDRRAVRRNATSHSRTGERPLIHCAIEMIPRILNKINRDQIKGLLILPQWCIYKFKQLIPQITSQIDLGHTQLVQDPGPRMKDLELKLPSGNITALRLTST
ncbi:MAG: hypothetical protein EZS28_018170 [Streblomastix strix]|uniref:Uncharacterized protein n=1 Tax=Streblomastix strix TaxID=222440 RepID=A0A5J4VUD4_9EUKA|nr:MAG: hypothetical protein EZS28_018170 [Streblomastix strix]